MRLVELSDLAVTLGRHRAVDGVTLSVGPGECGGLIGPNGAGKTTLLRAALGLLPARGGRRLGAVPRARLPAMARARAAACVPHARDIAWALSVATIVDRGRVPHRARGAGLSGADRPAIAAAMARMEVTACAERPAVTLSGGEQARVLLARALAQETPLILADEPTAGHDPAHRIAAMESFAGLAREGRRGRFAARSGPRRALLHPPGADGQGARRRRSPARRGADARASRRRLRHRRRARRGGRRPRDPATGAGVSPGPPAPARVPWRDNLCVRHPPAKFPGRVSGAESVTDAPRLRGGEAQRGAGRARVML